MTFDSALGRPNRSLLKIVLVLFPFALVGLGIERFFPYPYHDIIFATSFAVLTACLVLCTPYLMLAALSFYAMSQLPFPKTLASEAWRYHALLLAAVVFCLWRTWTLWPADAVMKIRPLPDAKAAPWWGYLLGGILATGLFGLMAYFFHFQE